MVAYFDHLLCARPWTKTSHESVMNPSTVLSIWTLLFSHPRYNKRMEAYRVHVPVHGTEVTLDMQVWSD